jgi:hypothetical protein
MPSIDAAAGQIRAVGVPILFLDTCIFLDIIRSTERCLPNCADQALELLKLTSASPPKCLLVVASIVPIEWNANANEVTAQVNRHLVKMEEQSSHFHYACEALGISAGFGRASYTRLRLAEYLRDLSQQLLGSALCLEPNDECMARAVGRVINDLRPSRKNGEVKDCAIIEEFLAVCRRLHGTGFARKRAFCTSNTADYCEVGKGLHPTLATEFASCNLSFTTNLPWAVHEITH